MVSPINLAFFLSISNNWSIINDSLPYPQIFLLGDIKHLFCVHSRLAKGGFVNTYNLHNQAT